MNQKPLIQSDSPTEFESLIVSGGDTRLDLSADGTNRYGVNPVQFEGVFNRGSCTCSPFSPGGFAAAINLYDRLTDDSFERVRDEHARKIKSLINHPGQDRFDIFFAPSGSDLCYYQLLFAKLIDPDRDVFNLVTCPEELGSGSNVAFEGRFYSSRNQFGDVLTPGDRLSDSLNVQCAQLPARDEHGVIVNHHREIFDLVHEHYRSHSVNGNLVIGSKSGIENNVTIVSQVPDSVLWTIDLCQYRASSLLINGLIGMNCSVMLTGSKFYQAPPFCAALLVPKTVSERLTNVTEDTVAPFAQIFSRYDVPPEFDAIQKLPARLS